MQIAEYKFIVANGQIESFEGIDTEEFLWTDDYEFFYGEGSLYKRNTENPVWTCKKESVYKALGFINSDPVHVDTRSFFKGKRVASVEVPKRGPEDPFWVETLKTKMGEIGTRGTCLVLQNAEHLLFVNVYNLDTVTLDTEREWEIIGNYLTTFVDANFVIYNPFKGTALATEVLDLAGRVATVLVEGRKYFFDVNNPSVAYAVEFNVKKNLGLFFSEKCVSAIELNTGRCLELPYRLSQMCLKYRNFQTFDFYGEWMASYDVHEFKKKNGEISASPDVVLLYSLKNCELVDLSIPPTFKIHYSPYIMYHHEPKYELVEEKPAFNFSTFARPTGVLKAIPSTFAPSVPAKPMMQNAFFAKVGKGAAGATASAPVPAVGVPNAFFAKVGKGTPPTKVEVEVAPPSVHVPFVPSAAAAFVPSFSKVKPAPVEVPSDIRKQTILPPQSYPEIKTKIPGGSRIDYATGRVVAADNAAYLQKVSPINMIDAEKVQSLPFSSFTPFVPSSVPSVAAEPFVPSSAPSAAAAASVAPPLIVERKSVGLMQAPQEPVYGIKPSKVPALVVNPLAGPNVFRPVRTNAGAPPRPVAKPASH